MRKGIILAGGTGTRLRPATTSISKQLLPVYDKPMIYYPLATLMSLSIREILIISSIQDISLYQTLLKDGKQWGLKLEYCIQKQPEGIAQAFLLAKDFIGDHLNVLILGDNIFYGGNLKDKLKKADQKKEGATIFAYKVQKPNQYGVIEFEKEKISKIVEKPKITKSNLAITGVYFFDKKVSSYSRTLKKSDRGEYEITDLINKYLMNNKLDVEIFNDGVTWLDAGTHDTLLEASQFVSTIEKRQGTKIACLEEIAYRQGWIDKKQIIKIAKQMYNSSYGKYLNILLDDIS